MAIEKDQQLIEIESKVAQGTLTFEDLQKAARESAQVQEKLDHVLNTFLHSLGREKLLAAIKTDATLGGWSAYIPTAVTPEEAIAVLDQASHLPELSQAATSKIGLFSKQEKAIVTPPTDKIAEEPIKRGPKSSG